MDNRAIGGGRMMTSWAARMHRGAASLGTVVTSCGHPTAPYPRRIEKVKFGVPMEEVCKNDIPGPLLILILKLNKEGPYKKDVFRAPGHQGNMKKLIHFLQSGRLVNIDNFSVYTIASVLKKFLRKIPGGIFGREGEARLFQIIEMSSIEDQRDHIHALISSLPVCTQRLVVLLFGTFRVIASNSERSQTGMTSEALGVSVAPSFFQSCVSDGKQAKMEDVMKFKAEVDVATKIMSFLIDHFGVSNLFGRENYEFYARITGRILRVEEDWIFSFRYPPDALVSPMSQQEESHSTPALMHALDQLDNDRRSETGGEATNSLSSIPESNLLESYTRLSISLEEHGFFKVASVHERQVARMKTRSEWFLSPVLGGTPSPSATPTTLSNILREDTAGNLSSCASAISAQASPQEFKQQQHTLVRRSSSKDKERRLVRRSSSKKNKENGASSTPTSSTSGCTSSSSPSSASTARNPKQPSSPPSSASGTSTPAPNPLPGPSSSSCASTPFKQFTPSKLQGQNGATRTKEEEDDYFVPNMVLQSDCTETDIQTFHVTLTYKPRI